MLALRRALVSSVPRLRWLSSQAQLDLSEGEQHLVNKLKEKLNPSEVRVQDISGGCGTFYAIYVASPAFKGLSTVKQHRLVTEALKKEIEGIHGLQIKTTQTP